MTDLINIAGRTVGPSQRCFIVAEAGVNHNGDRDIAFRLIDAAAVAGADAVKFQTFKADRLAIPTAPKAPYQTETTNEDESQLRMLRRLELSPALHSELIKHCLKKNILFLSSPFDEGSADLLEGLGVPAFKIASGEITNLPLLSHVARKGKPMILSTGMSMLAEVETAVRVITGAGNQSLVLLHCVSTYPANPSDANLRAMDTMAAAFKLPVGYSDHTLGIELALAAVALGACVIEKHLTVDRSLPGPDHCASLEPDEFSALVRGIGKVEQALGSGRKEPAESEATVSAVARKSLVAAAALSAGTKLTEDLIAIMRPGTGLPPIMRNELVGRELKRDVNAGELLRLSDFK